MGSRMKPTIFGENVAKGLKSWHDTAKKNTKHRHHSSQNTPFSSRPGTPLHGSTSPMHLLHSHPDDSLDNVSDSEEGWDNATYSNDRYQREEEPGNFRRDRQRNLEDGEIQEISTTQRPAGPRRTQSEIGMANFSFGHGK